MTPSGGKQRRFHRAGCGAFLALATLLGVLMVGPGRATAAEPRGKRAQAKAEFEKAQLHYRLGRFEEALQSYSRAYELFRAPALLFNIGQCHKNLQHHERAIFFFEGYLREEANAEKRALAQELIAASRAQLERERSEPPRIEPTPSAVAPPVEPRPVVAPPPPPVAVTEAPAPPPAAPVLVTAPETPEDQPADERPLHRTWWFWAAVGGVAAVATGAAIYYGVPKNTLPAGSLGTLDRRQ